MRVQLCQQNFTVGDLVGNEKIILDTMRTAEHQNIDLLIFPELAVSGYPPEDLLLRHDFLNACAASARRIAEASGSVTTVFGVPQATIGSPFTVDAEGRSALNAALVVRDGRSIKTYTKQLLPNYGVFDEARYFVPGKFSPDTYSGDLFTVKGKKVGVLICEDMWRPELAEHLAKEGADVIVSINASPFHVGKQEVRRKLIRRTAQDNRVYVAYVNMVGGQEQLVFDGDSMVVDPQGRVIHNLPRFVEERGICELSDRENALLPVDSEMQETHDALVLGLHDYVQKNGFQKVVIGLSGGIDSALTAALAVEALGPKMVTGYTMPSEYSSSGSLDDSYALAENLGIECMKLDIKDIKGSVMNVMGGLIKPAGLAEQNIQARIRGMLLMAITNDQGGIVVTTGNKSELAVGYCTLYGDMAGGYAVIKDLPKTKVYELARWINTKWLDSGSLTPLIPWDTIEKPPSAELAPDQVDTDSLPPYDVLDDILERYIEGHQSAAEIVDGTGYDPGEIYRVIRLVDRNEYKRRQGAPGVKITPRAFGRDRRLPITNGWTA